MTPGRRAGASSPWQQANGHQARHRLQRRRQRRGRRRRPADRPRWWRTRPSSAGSTTPTSTRTSAASRTSRSSPWQLRDRRLRRHAVGVAGRHHRADQAATSTGPRARASRSTPSELVTGEHSGLKTLPQMPADNPNLAPGAERRPASSTSPPTPPASRPPAPVGNAATVPRYPMNIYYNVATRAEEVDEYNWIYTSQADGGSGICENNPRLHLHRPARRRTGFDNYIVPLEARIAYDHVVSTNPAPHYAHQSNLAEDRILYPVLDAVLARYRPRYTTATPIVNPKFADTALQNKRQAAWAAALRSRTVEAYTLDGRVTIVNKGTGTLDVPVTVPNGTKIDHAVAAGHRGRRRQLRRRLRRRTLRLAEPRPQRDASCCAWRAEVRAVRVALVNEGTYPYVTGGVSTWCDQLVRGLSDVDWDLRGHRRHRAGPARGPAARQRPVADRGAGLGHRPPGPRQAPNGPPRGCAGACSATPRPTWSSSPKGCASSPSSRGRPRRAGSAAPRDSAAPAGRGAGLADVLLDAWAGPGPTASTCRGSRCATPTRPRYCSSTRCARSPRSSRPAWTSCHANANGLSSMVAPGREVAQRRAVPDDRARRVPAGAVPRRRRPVARGEDGAAALPPGAGPAGLLGGRPRSPRSAASTRAGRCGTAPTRRSSRSSATASTRPGSRR